MAGGTAAISGNPFGFRLDMKSGVPVYRQLIDQVLAAIAGATLNPGDRLPTVRQVAVDLAINPNTVVRAYKELEIRGRARQPSRAQGTFISNQPVKFSEVERRRRLSQFVADLTAPRRSRRFHRRGDPRRVA